MKNFANEVSSFFEKGAAKIKSLNYNLTYL